MNKQITQEQIDSIIKALAQTAIAASLYVGIQTVFASLPEIKAETPKENAKTGK